MAGGLCVPCKIALIGKEIRARFRLYAGVNATPHNLEQKTTLIRRGYESMQLLVPIAGENTSPDQYPPHWGPQWQNADRPRAHPAARWQSLLP